MRVSAKLSKVAPHKKCKPYDPVGKKVALNTQIQLYIIYFARNTNIYIYQYIIFLQQLQLNILVITIDTIQKSSHVRVLSVCWSGIKRSFYLLVFFSIMLKIYKNDFINGIYFWDLLFLNLIQSIAHVTVTACNRPRVQYSSWGGSNFWIAMT